MKRTIKIYLDEADYKSLKEKAETLYKGRGSLIRYIEKISREPVCFLDENAKVLLKALNLKSTNGDN